MKRKNFGSLMLLSGLVLAVFLLVGSFVWMQDKANMLLAVFVLILYGMGQWLTVVYWQKIQEDWEATGEILGRLQQAVTDIPVALDANLKSIATRLSDNQQKALSELKSEVDAGARKTLETGAALIGDSISKNFKAPVDSLKILLDVWEAKTREQADRIQAMAEQARRDSAEAATRGAALVADSLEKNLRGPLASLEDALAADREKSRAEVAGAKALWQELHAAQKEGAERAASLAGEVTAEIKALAVEGARAAEDSRAAWAEKAAEVQAAWDRRAQALEDRVLVSLKDEAKGLGESLAAASGEMLGRIESLQAVQSEIHARALQQAVAGLETQVLAMQEAAGVFADGLTKIREASTALVRDVGAQADAGRAALIEDFSAAQREALTEAARLLEAQGQLGLDVAGKVADLAAGVSQGSKDLQELAHLSQVNQVELQAGVSMLNAGLADILQRLDSQASAGEGYQDFLADLGRSLASFQERAAETLVENALKTQEILMEVLGQAERKAAGGAVASSQRELASPA